MNTPFRESELPVNEFQYLGLARTGEIRLSPQDIHSLLSGRRTDMITLNNLESGNFKISKIEARLSLQREDNGEVSIRLHPVYKEAIRLPQLREADAEKLEQGLLDVIKWQDQTPGSRIALVIEYDRDTREYITYSPSEVSVPEKVNGELLTILQKEDFRNGKAVTLSDGTQFQHRGTERLGILANTSALVLEFRENNSPLFLRLTGVRNLIIGSSKQMKETPAFQSALQEMEEFNRKPPVGIARTPFQQSRGYGHGTSR